MPLLRRSTPGSRLTPAQRAALADAVEHTTFELIPLKNVREQFAGLPAGATVSVTASPAKGLEATVELCAELAAAGFTPIPHLSARMVRDRAHLRELLARIGDLGIGRAFVVGGDAEEPGDFPDGLSLLREMAELGLLPREVGVPCYPQGHAFIGDEALAAALRDKAPFASYMATQLCFDPKAIATWLAARRTEGITLPVKLGTPGVAEIPRLLSISARIGVRDASRFVMKNTRFVGELLASGGMYRPTGLLEGLAPVVADPASGIVGLHLYTFNAVAATEAWRTGFIAALRAGAAA